MLYICTAQPDVAAATKVNTLLLRCCSSPYNLRPWHSVSGSWLGRQCVLSLHNNAPCSLLFSCLHVSQLALCCFLVVLECNSVRREG